LQSLLDVKGEGRWRGRTVYRKRVGKPENQGWPRKEGEVIGRKGRILRCGGVKRGGIWSLAVWEGGGKKQLFCDGTGKKGGADVFGGGGPLPVAG